MKNIFEEFSQRLQGLLPPGLPEEVRNNIKASTRTIFEQMDLVTREELDIQENVLRKTRMQLEGLEHRLSLVEKVLAKENTDKPEN